jgi:hypothetical protein
MAISSNIVHLDTKSKTTQKQNKQKSISEERSIEIDDFCKMLRLNNETWLDKAIISEIRKFKIDHRLAHNIHDEVISPILRRVDFIRLKPQAKETTSREINHHIMTLIQDHLPEHSEMLEIDDDSINLSSKFYELNSTVTTEWF